MQFYTVLHFLSQSCDMSNTYQIQNLENEQADWIMHQQTLLNNLEHLTNKIQFANKMVQQYQSKIDNLKHENNHKDVTNRYHYCSEEK